VDIRTYLLTFSGTYFIHTHGTRTNALAWRTKEGEKGPHESSLQGKDNSKEQLKKILG